MGQLSDVYEKLVETITIKELIEQGHLVPAITYGAKIDTSNIKLKGQDFDTEEMYKFFDKKTLYSGVVEKYNKLTEGTKAIVFNVNVEHSKKVTQSFLEAGISAAHLDGKTSKANRLKILEAFNAGLITVLNNVDVLTTGYDEWTIETVIINRATKSLPLYLQMCGRGSRPTPTELRNKTGYLQKDYFNILDMGGNVFSLGFWEQGREFSLSHKTKTTVEAAPVKTCPEDKKDELGREGCGAILYASAVNCKFCGFIFPKPVKKEAEDVDFIQLENHEYLPLELVGKSWGSMNIEQLEKVRTAKGYGLGWIVKQILINKDLDLLEYGEFRKFKNPSAWVRRMNNIYVKN
jgi:superfamily II DNA or RNA helicase